MRFALLVLSLALLALPAVAQTPATTPPETVDATFDGGRVTLSHGVLCGVGILSTPAHQAVQWAPTGGLGYQIGLGFLPASDKNDRLHLSLGAMLGVGKTGAAATLALLPGWGGYLKIPFMSAGPAVLIPIGQPTASPTFEVLATWSVEALIQTLVSGL